MKVRNCFQLVEGGGGGASTTTAPTVSAVTSKESSNLVYPTALTTSLPVVATESPILSFGRQYVMTVSGSITRSGNPDLFFLLA